MFLALALIQLMWHVSQAAVVALVTFVLVGAVMGLLAVARELDVLTMLRGIGGPATAHDAALAMHGFRSVFLVSMVFSALWLIPFGWLVMRCNFLPRLLGVALILGCGFYFANFIGLVLVAGATPASTVDSAYQATMAGIIVGVLSGVPSIIGEFGTCLALLMYGLRRGPAPRNAALAG